MKMKWNEKTKKITVIAALAVVGIIVLTGISLCIYKDAPREVEIAEAETQEDVVDISEDNLTVPAQEETVTPETEEIVISTEVSKEAETENTQVQSLQPAPVKTENQKPDELSVDEVAQTEESKESKSENSEKPAAQQPQQPSPENSTSPKHGDIQGDKIYIDGFGWVDYNGGETIGIPAHDIYENGNKIGIMD